MRQNSGPRLTFVLTSILFIGAMTLVGCGGDGDGDSDANNQNIIDGVWEVNSQTICSPIQCDTYTYPAQDGNSTFHYFMEIKDNRFRFYYKFINLPPDFPFSDGTYFCSSMDESFVIEGNEIIGGDEDTDFFTLSGNNLRIDSQTPDGSDSVTTNATKSDNSNIAESVQNCQVFE